MADIVKSALRSHLNKDIKDAIEEVGGVVKPENCPFDYPDIIKTQLSAGGLGGALLESSDKSINITPKESNKVFDLSANANAKLVRDVNGLTTDNTVQDALESLLKNESIKNIEIVFTDIDGNFCDCTCEECTCGKLELEPLTYYIKVTSTNDNVKYVKLSDVTYLDGDIITSDEDGQVTERVIQKGDYEITIKTTLPGKKPNTKYLRLSVGKGVKPIYIDLSEISGGESGGMVTEERIENGAVSTDKIKDDAITVDKINDSAILPKTEAEDMVDSLFK